MIKPKYEKVKKSLEEKKKFWNDVFWIEKDRYEKEVYPILYKELFATGDFPDIILEHYYRNTLFIKSIALIIETKDFWEKEYQKHLWKNPVTTK